MSLKILFCGDVCFKVQPEVDYELSLKILAPMREVLSGADMRVMNLECPLAPEGVGAPIYKSGPNIIGRPRNVGFLEAAGCDVAILANNHIGDWGGDALTYTLGLLGEHSIPYVGAGENLDEAYSAYRAVRGGVSLSILAVCENEFGTASGDRSGAAGFDLEGLGDKIEEEKEVSDYVIVVFHGGCEHNPLPSPLCRERYRTLVRLGTDAVIAGHTHCMQGYEYYHDRPIVYSLGNFLFKWDKPARPSWYHGYIAQLTIDAESPRQLMIRPIPYVFDPDKNEISPLAGDKLEHTLRYIERISLVIPDMDELTRYYKGWCIISGLNYIKSLVAKPEYLAPSDRIPEVAPLKNLLCCEAHNELMRTTLELIYNGELELARVWAGELEGLYYKEPSCN